MLSGVNMEGRGGRDVRKLNTQGCCFLCLKPNKTTSEESGETDVTKPELIRQQMSIRCLTRYLQVNLDEMEQATFSPATSKAGSKPEVDVKVDLCERCEKLANKFSSLFQQLERIQMELEFYLAEIRCTVSHSSKTPELVRNYAKEMASHIDSLPQLVLVDKLRSEIGEKGLKRGWTPTVSLKKIERLPKQEVPDPFEEMDSADNLVDFGEGAWSSRQNCAAQESESNFDQRSTPEMKKDREDLPVISPKNDLKQSMKVKIQQTEDFCFSNAEFEEGEVFRVKTENQEDVPTVDRYEDIKLEFTDETPSLQSPFEQKPKRGMYYTKNPSTGMYECKKCSKTSSCSRTIGDHFQSVHQKLRLKCDICNVSVFSLLTNLTRHKKTCRRKLKEKLANEKDPKFKFICETCEKKFKSKKSLSGHQLLVHENIARYPCDLCDKKFKMLLHLNEHKDAVHFGKRIYCGFCNKPFTRKRDMLSHQKICAQKLVLKEEPEDKLPVS